MQPSLLILLTDKNADTKEITMKKLRVGLVGCGKIAASNHVPGMLQVGKKKAEIVALYDIKREKAEALAKSAELTDAAICRSLPALLASEIDAVILATPNSFHYAQTMAALKAGKHVLVEKPMATSVAEANKMIAHAAACKLVLQVNQSLRFVPLYIEMSKRVAAGAIGRPLHARCLRAATASPDVGWSPGATWFVQKRYGGSLVGDIAVHMADFLQCAFGPVARVHAITRKWSHEVPDNVTALFDFANGATGVLELSWTFPKGASALELTGDQGVLRTIEGGFEITFKDAKRKSVQVKAADLKALPDSHAMFVRNIARGVEDAWVAGREALALCEAINDSNRTKRGVRPKNHTAR